LKNPEWTAWQNLSVEQEAVRRIDVGRVPSPALRACGVRTPRLQPETFGGKTLLLLVPIRVH